MQKHEIQIEQQTGLFFELRKNKMMADLDITGYWSYPAFIRSRDKAVNWLYLIAPTIHHPGKKITAIFRPKSVLLTQPNSNKIIHYNSFRIGHDPFPNVDWKIPKALFPHDRIKHYTLDTFAYKERELTDLCVLESDNFKDENRALSEKFCKTWTDLTHPFFIPYLEKLAPEFIKMLLTKN
jgi:hypothetical protein